MKQLLSYFPDMPPEIRQKMARLEELYRLRNEQVNVISRKDIIHFYERHVLHSLSVALFFSFLPGTRILDVGTGGGFPGIPLAILFPDIQFTLVDSIAKKIRVVNEVKEELQLDNVTAVNTRVEKMHESFDYVVSRAVTNLPGFVALVAARVAHHGFNDRPNGIIYLKGGFFQEELNHVQGWNKQILNLFSRLPEPFFETKKVVFLFRNP